MKLLTHSLCKIFFMFSVFATLSVAAQQTQTEGPFKTIYRYDMAGRLVGTISPDPDGAGVLKYPVVRNNYTAGGLLQSVEIGELNSLVGMLAEDFQPVNWSGFTIYSKRIFEYDGYGRKIKEMIVAPNNNSNILMLSQYTYNTKGLVQCKARRMNKSVYGSLPVSACDQSAQGIDGPDRITRYTYDELDQVLTEERGVGTGLQQVYVTNTYKPGTRLLATQTDVNGNKTELRYDTAARLTHRVYPSKTTAGQLNESDYNYYTYDANNNISSERKRNGATINFYYDNNNRLVVKDYANNSLTADIYYNYDLRGITLHSRFSSDAGEGIINTADGFGNIVRTDTTMGGTTRTLRYSYDLNNNRTHVYHADNIFFKYDFDGLNRVNKLSEGSTSMLDVIYNAAGRRHSLSRNGNVSRTEYYYDFALRMNNFIQDFPGTGLDLTNTFVYNPANQITELTQSNSLYQYTGNENRTGAYALNGLNQYTSINGSNVFYDTNGNLTNDNGTLYNYDDENRLRSTGGVSMAASTLKYDPLGRLYETNITVNGVTTKTTYLYDGDALVAEYNASNMMTNRYVHGDQVDEPWIQYEGTAIGASYRRYLHADHQGSIIARSTSAGALHGNALSYDSYGIPKSTNQGRFGYTGQAWLKELGLYHYKARVYNPKLGRFLQTDPIFYKDNMNMYGYVGNDPVNMRDPTGLKGDGCFMSTSGNMQVCAGPALDSSSDEPGSKKEVETKDTGPSAMTMIGLYMRHTLRNEISKNDKNMPATLEGAQALENSGQLKLLSPQQSIYHNMGGANNAKYVSTDGHFEAVYNRDSGELVTDMINRGTFNYTGPDDAWGHFKDDVVPYWFWSNGSGDTTTMWDRVNGCQFNCSLGE